MAIQAGDIKLVASSVMNDTAGGGGPPSSTIIQDGVSNAIFPDISELDRAGGRVNMRKVFASVQTNNTDTFLGANVIVADPPSDPNVSIALFSTNNTFDTRAEAKSRVESYLAPSAEYNGFLYENHIIGQRVIQIFQRYNVSIPTVGQTLVLIKNEGLTNEERQFVRATDVSFEYRTFFDTGINSDYTALIVDISISDALRYDFPGTAANRSFARAANATRVRETNVADAGVYAGATPLAAQASLGDFTVQTESVFSQIVPNAQSETALADIRTNGLQSAFVASGNTITRYISQAFTTTQTMFVGAPIYPGSLVISNSTNAVDKAGRLLLEGTGYQLGTVNYETGVVTLLTNWWGSGNLTFIVTFKPAATPELVSEQRAIRITAGNRSLSYTQVLEPAPAPLSLSVSYLAQGRWYTLRDDGGGSILGDEPAYGAGTVNYATGSISITLGALPDVGSAVIIQFYADTETAQVSNTTLTNGGKAYIPLNTSGAQSEEPGDRPININGLTITWANGTQKTATDDGLGNITGDATGTVDYTDGVIRLSPNEMPAPGTVFLFDVDSGEPLIANVSWSGSQASIGVPNIIPGSVSFTADVNYFYTASRTPASGYAWAEYDTKTVNVSVTDAGNGTLRFRDPGNGQSVTCGAINYATGQITLNAVTVLSLDSLGPKINYLIGTTAAVVASVAWDRPLSGTTRTRTASMGAASEAVTYASQNAAPDSISVTVNEYRVRALAITGYVLQNANFTLGGSYYLQLPNNALSKDPSSTTGAGTPAGTVQAAASTITLQAWPTNASPTITNWRATLAPPADSLTSPFGSGQTILRTAASPIRTGSFSVLGTMLDGTTFNVTADANGRINSARVKGRVDYEYGLIELYFVSPVFNEDRQINLTFLGIPGVGNNQSADIVRTSSLRYNAVSYQYIPLDASILGIDPVRLPTDGRVPIFRTGGFAVVGNTASISATVSNGQTINCGRLRLSRVRVVGSDGDVITVGYTADLDAGTVTFTDVTGYAQPVTIEHRVEDMGVVSQVDINGEITFTRPLTHTYPVSGSMVSSALIAGDLFASVNTIFDQATWNGTWSDVQSGSSASATFNNALNPITVTNRGAITERWAIQFTNSTAFNVIGENVGVIATGNTTSDMSPTNPATNVPYFTIPAAGWGLGWTTGNVLRFNTVGAEFPVWVIRTIQQGPETVTNDSFTLLIRGDVDQP